MKHLPSLAVMQWSNPHGVDLNQPYVYLITVAAPHKEYRYVGKGSSPSRMDAYARNVSRVLEGKTKRTAVKRNGDAQREGNLRYRYVHLVLAVTVRDGWRIEHVPLENCEKAHHTTTEATRKREHDCDLNDGPSWLIEEFDHLAGALR